MNKTTTLSDLVQQECCNLVSDECIGTNVNGGSLKRNSKTTIIYQYPYEFVCPNAGKCWVLEGIPCDYFERQVLPLAKLIKNDSTLVNEYEKLCKKPRYCECGAELAKREQCCQRCRKKRRQKTNRENQRKHRSKSNTIP
tara:strand:+ start:76 stop:495 length:420 start_codon:yes stop_codon:yes gene_type:complete